MKLKLYNYFELFGLVIVLLATTFQLTFVRLVSDISNDSDFMRIEEKVDIIWFEITDKSNNPISHNNRENNFNYWTRSGDFVNKQEEWFNEAYAIIMIIGSILLVLGRWLEIKSIKKIGFK